MAKPYFLIVAVTVVGLGLGLGAGFVFLPGMRRAPVTLPTFASLASIPAGACSPNLECTAPALPPIQTSGSVPSDLLASAFATKENWTVAPGTREILVPHHLVAARQMASLYAATPKPSIVYLVTPDHFSQGKTAFTTTERSFATASSTVDGSADAVRTLLTAVPSLSLDDAPFVKELGVYNELPFIAYQWPSVKVVPIIVRIDATQEERISLAQALEARLQADPHALLVVTVDFSHYLPAEVADFHDVLALDVVKSLSDLEADKVELDSPGALAVGLKVARDMGLGDVTVQDHTNSLRLLNATVSQESTSHIFASFSPGPIQAEHVSTLLFTGDMMFDREVATRSQKAGSLAYPFQNIQGQEDRFFKGQDLVVANLEGPVTAVRRPPVKSLDFAFSPLI
ncbi:MAG: AmmeMemoRadiSam system protein B, partial [Patescibacteria group bacterium]